MVSMPNVRLSFHAPKLEKRQWGVNPVLDGGSVSLQGLRSVSETYPILQVWYLSNRDSLGIFLGIPFSLPQL